MTSETPVPAGARPGSLDRLLGLFSDVQAGEGSRALLMLGEHLPDELVTPCSARGWVD